MFNNNVTQTYNFQDASQEIIIMLLGAFLLGCLLSWLLNKLFNKDYSISNQAYRYDHQASNEDLHSFRQSHTLQSDTTGEVRIVDKPTNLLKPILTRDDLTKISGIDEHMQTELLKIGINSYAGLRDMDSSKLIAFQGKQQEHKKEIETWQHQASLAAKGEWDKLKDYQGFVHRVQHASTTAEKNTLVGVDDLTQIVGVDSTIESILNTKDITNFKQMSHLDSDILKQYIVESDSKYSNIETESWPHQAAMAEKSQWDELKIYQEFMHADSDTNSNTVKETHATPNNNQQPTVIPETSAKQKTSDNGNRNDNLNENESNTGKTIDKPVDEEISDQNLSDHDDLKKIEGIGPKIEEVLNNGGIYTFSQLHNSNKTRLRKLLDEAGSQFRMHNPESWSHQAAMADKSQWEELKIFQDTLSNDKASAAKNRTKSKEKENKTDAKQSTKLSIAHQTDDFKQLEGIGPKIQELLNKAGIFGFKELSNQSSDYIKKLLDDAGPQFQMHQPESWPYQARLAANGKWKELKEYQDFLISGRE